MSSKILIFNWKMNPATLKEAVVLAKASDFKGVAIAPPFPFLEEVGKVLKKSALGAQDLFWEDRGAFTGEVSAKELKSIGVEYVIIGHSERRHKLGETDEMISKKLKAAIENGLTPVLCVGETKKEKDSGNKEEVIKRQIETNFLLLREKLKNKSQNLFVAYEPVWAIGTGDPEAPESALKTIQYIKSLAISHKPLVVKVLYGGSVHSKNLADYLKFKEVDGALVGGASLNKDEVKKMAALVR